ncbi:OprD family outer membrane porin [Sulfurospirillum sp. T05]|uniref:OprD family outer membrane porin n=1 Tax=Sulfurospirillum tamanense TaxID=2813362 RepID=A0ABS2WRU3_9BACT|nr:OprD family outer membrane porin [Sulfurospirillum tamanensis]MBN2964360.1 OprD family outer membrane porin [Sulfurospirillum tamanensis]
MKAIHLSLAALVAMGTMAHAGESLEDAFKNGKVSGAFKFVYANGTDSDAAALNPQDPANNSNVGSVAVELKYLTDDFYGFKLGLGFQSGHDLKIHKKNTTEDDSRNSVSASHLHNLYLQYSFLNSNVIVGRQGIKLPLLMSSSAWPLEDYFTGAVLTVNEIPDTVLKLVYIKEWNKRYGSDSNGGIVQEDVHYEKPLYSVFVKNTSIKDVTFEGQYLTTNEKSFNGDAPALVAVGGFDQYYARADYKLPTEHPVTLGVLWGGAEFDAAGKKDASFYGARAMTNIGEVGLKAAYTSVDDDADFPSTLGHVPDAVLDTSMLVNNAIFAGIDAVSLQASYNFGIPALRSAVKIGHFKQSDEGKANSGTKLGKATEVNVDVNYAFAGLLKGFSTRVWAGHAKYDDNVDKDDFTYAKWYVTYRF